MKYVICHFFSFHSLPLHFLDGFFYYAEDFEFDVVSLVYFFSSCLCFWWLTCLSYLYSGKQYFISCFICCYLLPLLTKDTNCLNGYKNNIRIYAVYKRPTSVLETHTDWKWEGGKRYSMQMEIQRKPDWQFSYQKKKIDLKIKSIIRAKEGHYKMIKGSVQEKDKTILNIYIPNIGARQYIRWTLTDIKWEIESNAIIVGHVNTPPLPMDRSLKQKINKET